MPITRGQMKRQLRMGGGIMDIVPREQALLGGIKKAAKKVGKTVKKIAKSDLGKAALLYAGTAGLGALGAGQAGTGFKFLGKGSFLSPSNVFANLATTGKKLGILKSVADYGQVPTRSGPLAKFFDKPLSSLANVVTGGGQGGGITKLATLGLVSKFLTDSLGMPPEQAEAELARDPSGYLEKYYRNLNPNATEAEVMEFVTTNTAEYAVGGRVGFDEGADKKIQMIKDMLSRGADDELIKDITGASQAEIDQVKNSKAMGGKMDTPSDNAVQAAGIEGLPIRQNKAGVKELDLRNTGGFIQPVGIKEKEDDIPAMLSNNEFVFTADAVRGAGDADVELGAQRMYDTMKRLEAGGKA